MHEFEAEGPKEVVAEQFSLWKELITAPQSTGKSPAVEDRRQFQAVSAANLGGATPAGLAGLTAEGTAQLFATDEKRDVISLRVHPTSDDRDADAVLLLLLAYKPTLDEVPVTKLLESMRVSGLKPDRLDRSVSPHLAAGFILRSGRAKGGKYRLTNTGAAQAIRVAQGILAQLT